MSPWLFLLFILGLGAGIVGTIIYFATRPATTPTPPPTEEPPPTVTLTVTPRHFCVGTPIRVQWTTNGVSTNVSADRAVTGFPRTEQTRDVMVTIEGPPDRMSFDTVFTVVARNSMGGTTRRTETTTGHRGEFIISRAGEARCVIEQIFPDRRFGNPNARTFRVTLDADEFGDMMASGVEISPYPTPDYGYPVPDPHRFMVFHDNTPVIPMGEQIATYTGLVRGEWKVTTQRLRISDPEEPDEPCEPNEFLHTPLLVGIRIRVACS
jgi:hypothetical protein